LIPIFALKTGPLKYHIVLLIVGFALLGACKKQHPESQALIDEARIKAYLTANHIQAIRDSSGLYYYIQNEGDSVNRPGLGSTITVNYMGTLLNGTVFTSTVNANDSTTTPLTFPLANTVPGWQIGLPKITKGGSMLLIIPAALGYGNKPQGDIPANSVLIYQIELLEVY
jgi:FKBP-type peptidyl-prolyl cis-trans isomerase FkpA